MDSWAVNLKITWWWRAMLKEWPLKTRFYLQNKECLLILMLALKSIPMNNWFWANKIPTKSKLSSFQKIETLSSLSLKKTVKYFFPNSLFTLMLKTDYMIEIRILLTITPTYQKGHKLMQEIHFHQPEQYIQLTKQSLPKRKYTLSVERNSKRLAFKVMETWGSKACQLEK